MTGAFIALLLLILFLGLGAFASGYEEGRKAGQAEGRKEVYRGLRETARRRK